MKKRILLAVILVGLVFFTGCATIEYNIDLNKDGSGNLGFTMLYDNDLLTYLGEGIKQSKEQLTSKGFKVEDYKTEKQTGFKAVKAIKNIDEWNAELKGTDEASSKDANFEIKKDKDKIYVNAVLDFSDNKQQGAMLKGVDFKINLKMPFKVLEHNATKVQNGVYTWNIDFTAKNEIKLVADTNNILEIITIALLSLTAIVGVVILVFIMLAKKKNKASNQEEIVGDDTTYVTEEQEIESQEEENNVQQDETVEHSTEDDDKYNK